MVFSQSLFFSLILLTSQALLANNMGHANMIGVSQGVSAPTQTSNINFSNGFTSENPVGVIYQTQGRISGQYDTGNGNSHVGGEVGVGNGQFGVAGGYREADCEGCSGRAQGALGVSLAEVGLGLRFGEGLYGAGLLFNPNGSHRFGLMAEFDKPNDQTDQLESFALGYSYFSNGFSFSLDASQRSFQVGTVTENVTKISPALAIYLNRVSFSLTYDRFLNTPSGFSQDNLWFGVGFGTLGSWYLNIYNDYVNDWAFSLSFFF